MYRTSVWFAIGITFCERLHYVLKNKMITFCVDVFVIDVLFVIVLHELVHTTMNEHSRVRIKQRKYVCEQYAYVYRCHFTTFHIFRRTSVFKYLLVKFPSLQQLCMYVCFFRLPTYFIHEANLVPFLPELCAGVISRTRMMITNDFYTT